MAALHSAFLADFGPIPDPDYSTVTRVSTLLSDQ